MFSSKPPATAGDTKSHTPLKNGNVMEGLVNTFKGNPSSTLHDASNASIQTAKRKFAMQTFVETTKVALDVLGELADIHPAIKGMPRTAAVVAFKLVVTLDLKRRDNDDKVQALRVEMQSMMAVFLQLKDHPDPSTFYDDKYLQNLVLEIKEAIETASSFCDYYMKKSVMRRCLKSFIYENHFTTYAQTFYDLGVRLHRQLSVHATWGIYTTLQHSKTLETQMDDIKSQLKSLFSLLATDREKELQKIIDSSGGANACVNSEASLQELIKASGEEFERDGKQQLKQSLQDELSESLDKALQQNLAVFQGKLTLQLREIDLSISRESNRIITALSGGHEQIIDKGWKSRVKARNFVFALRDFYHGASHQQRDPHHRKPASPTGDHDNDLDTIATQPTGTDDRWALYYINVSFLQPIAEAIDDDGSSFITTREVNDFIINKREGCSALQWLAFWAAGWHSSVSQYVDKIYRLLRKFHRLREKVRYENLEIYDMYLHHGSFNRLYQLLRSTTRSSAYIHPELAMFRDKFTKAEEQKLLENLDMVSFHVDSAATVELITGPYRIERVLGQRMRDLSAVFQQINISPESHFMRYAFGMFHTLYVAKDSREKDTATLNAWESLPKEAGEDDDIEICPLDISVDILQYKPDHPSEFDQSFLNTDLVHPDYNYGPLYGSWSAVLYDRFHAPVYGMFNVVLQPSVPQPETENRWGTGTASSRSGSHGVQYSVYPKHAETQSVAISIVFFGGWLHFLGRFNESASSISGTWVNAPTDDVSRENFTEILQNHFQGVFVFSRTPPSLVRFRYTPSELEESPAKARWSFVKQSILYIIRRDTLDRKYVTTTLKEWRRFVELNIMFFAKDLSEDERKDLYRLENCLPPSIAFSLFNMAVHFRRSLLTHRGM
ncbi:hypothetical protein H0H93_003432 [Arthromyces matolae]|nr:hypothetical protein H0H93_003432 [Arthromyces matolae]